MKEKLIEWNKQLQDLSLEEGFTFVSKHISGKHLFSTSFGIEDQVITHILNYLKTNIKVFTLDTGRLFPETYDLFARTQSKYQNINIKTYFPSENDIQKYISENGINGFYNSIENRKSCCNIRKVIPLSRALNGASLWITGLRAEQSDYRTNMQFLEWNSHYSLIKYNPLLNYTLEDIESYVNKHGIPVNNLYKKGYLSIGCAPCTHPLEPGEDFRAGRWWWEKSQKECGLHSSNKN